MNGREIERKGGRETVKRMIEITHMLYQPHFRGDEVKEQEVHKYIIHNIHVFIIPLHYV